MAGRDKALSGVGHVAPVKLYQVSVGSKIKIVDWLRHPQVAITSTANRKWKKPDAGGAGILTSQRVLEPSCS